MEKVTDAELLEMACEFNVGPEPIVSGRLSDPWPFDDKPTMVTVKNMGNPDGGPDRWAILRHNFCLNKNGLWQYQPMNSSKTDHFYSHCRYESAQEAILYFRRWKAAIVAWGQKKVARAKSDEIVVLNYDDCPSKLRRF